MDNNNRGEKRKSAADFIFEEEERKRKEQILQKQDRKRYQKYKESVEEELVPKATGREAMIEKKHQKAEYTRKQDDSPEHDDSYLMGGGDSFQDALRREKLRKQRFTERKQREHDDRLHELKSKEDATMKMFQDLVQLGNIPLLNKP